MARKSDDGGIRSVTFKAGDGPEVTFDSVEELGRSKEFRDGVKAALEDAVGADRLVDLGEHAPLGRLAPPAPIAFMSSEWVESETLEELAEELIAKWPELRFLDGYRIRVLWKESGGDSRGLATLGKCSKPAGVARYFALCDWVIWLAADHCRKLAFTDEQIEALLYHELKHCVLVGKDLKPGVRGHDYEVFADEISRYGFWSAGRQALKQTVQGRLMLEEAD